MVLLLSGAGAITRSRAQEPSVPPLALPLAISGEEARPTAAWLEFCRLQPDECLVDRAEPETIAMSASAWDDLAAINAFVNATITPITDEKHWGVVDRWDFPDDGSGDCEDMQILKRRLLIRAGFPRRALRMTVVLDELGQGHAVLMARTDRGDFILDNKRNAVLPWNETGYEYLRREGAESSAWVALSRHGATVATANR